MRYVDWEEKDEKERGGKREGDDWMSTRGSKGDLIPRRKGRLRR